MDTKNTILDSHAHLLLLAEKSPEVFTDFIAKAGPAPRILDIATHTDDLEPRLALLKQIQYSYFSMGIYPSYAGDTKHNEQEVTKLYDFWTQNKNSSLKPCVLGEIGIDRFHDYPGDQKHLFLLQIELAKHTKLPIVIHARDSLNEVAQILDEAKYTQKAVMHCWSGTCQDLENYVARGFYISFAGNSTYPKNSVLRECITLVPLEQLLIESDSPYLSPLPYRGKINSPLLTEHTLRLCSEIKGIPEDVLFEILCQNFDTLCGLTH